MLRHLQSVLYIVAFRYLLYVLVTGQILSSFWTGLGVFVILLDNHTGKDISTTLAAGVYFVLSLTCGPYMALQRNFVAKLKTNWWKFVILGITDVQGSYLQNLALKYTTVTSSMVMKLFLSLPSLYTCTVCM